MFGSPVVPYHEAQLVTSFASHSARAMPNRLSQLEEAGAATKNGGSPSEVGQPMGRAHPILGPTIRSQKTSLKRWEWKPRMGASYEAAFRSQKTSSSIVGTAELWNHHEATGVLKAFGAKLVDMVRGISTNVAAANITLEYMMFLICNMMQHQRNCYRVIWHLGSQELIGPLGSSRPNWAHSFGHPGEDSTARF